MKTLLLSLILTGLTLYGNGQDKKFRYHYDNAGNRISRVYVPGIVRKIDPTSANLDSLLQEKPKLPQADQYSQPTNSINGLETSIGETAIALYPNPTQGFLTITLKNYSEVDHGEIAITDMEGKHAYRGSILQAKFQIDMGNYPAGTYLVNITINGKRKYYAVIKE